MSVERALVTGSNEDDLLSFACHVAFFANRIERRKLTDFYTVMGDDWRAFLKFGELFKVTIQQMGPERDKEVWNTVLQGTAKPWVPPKKRAKKK